MRYIEKMHEIVSRLNDDLSQEFQYNFGMWELHSSGYYDGITFMDVMMHGEDGYNYCLWRKIKDDFLPTTPNGDEFLDDLECSGPNYQVLKRMGAELSKSILLEFLPKENFDVEDLVIDLTDHIRHKES